jgi:hypothetical protein
MRWRWLVTFQATGMDMPSHGQRRTGQRSIDHEKWAAAQGLDLPYLDPAAPWTAW